MIVAVGMVLVWVWVWVQMGMGRVWMRTSRGWADAGRRVFVEAGKVVLAVLVVVLVLQGRMLVPVLQVVRNWRQQQQRVTSDPQPSHPRPKI